MIYRYRISDSLHNSRLTCSRRRNNHRSLTFTNRSKEINDSRRHIISHIRAGQIEFLIRMKRSKVIEMHTVNRHRRIFTINAFYTKQCKIFLIILRSTNLSADSITRFKTTVFNLTRRNIYIIRSRLITVFYRTKETITTFRHNIKDTTCEDDTMIISMLFQNIKYDTLFLHRIEVFFKGHTHLISLLFQLCDTHIR